MLGVVQHTLTLISIKTHLLQTNDLRNSGREAQKLQISNLINE